MSGRQASASRTTRGRTGAAEARNRPPAPDDLAEAGASLWRSVVGRYELPEHLLFVLASAARELDAADLADRAVGTDGALVVDRFGARKPHPGLGVARSSRLAASRLLKSLDLELPLAGPLSSRRPGGRLRKEDA